MQITQEQLSAQDFIHFSRGERREILSDDLILNLLRVPCVSARDIFGFSWFPGGKNRLLAKWLNQLELFGWKSLAISRLTPFLPCSIVNYGYGLTNMTLFVYTTTNLIFFIPYKLIMAYIGSHL